MVVWTWMPFKVNQRAVAGRMVDTRIQKRRYHTLLQEQDCHLSGGKTARVSTSIIT